MSTNEIDMDHGAVAEQTNGVPSISSPTEVNQEYQKKQTAAKTLTPPPTSTTAVTGNSTQTKEEVQANAKQTSTNSNTDSTQISGNKSGGAQPSKSKIKRLSRTVTSTFKRFTLGNPKQQGRDNDINEVQEEGEPRLEQGEKMPEQHRATNLPQNNKDLLGALHHVPIEQPVNPLSITTKVGDNTKQQQDQDQDDYDHIDHVEAQSPEPENVPKDIASLTKLVVKQNTAIESLTKLVAAHTTAIASLEAQVSGSPTPNDKVREIKPVLREVEVTTSPIQERPGEGLTFRKADGISLTEVANLVKELNAQIDQAASHIMDLLLNRQSSSSGNDLEIAGDGLRNDLQDHLGSRLGDELQRRLEGPEIDPMVAQIALQAGLVHACSRIINDWNPPFWTDGLAFSRVYDNIARAEGPVAADTWKALTRNYMASHGDQLEANKKYLEEVLLKLIIAVSGLRQSGEALLQQCIEKVDDIAKKAIDIHQVISQETRSTDLSTFTIESGADFDQSQMEDTEGSDSKAGPTLPGKVVCTVEMGLRGKKRVPSRQQSGDGKVGGGVTLKAKVVLPATLGET